MLFANGQVKKCLKSCFRHFFFQSLFAEPLSIQSNSVQVLKALWEKTQLKGTHSFETAMIQSTFPHQKVSLAFFSENKQTKKQLKNFALTFRTTVHRPLWQLQQVFSVLKLWKTKPLSLLLPLLFPSLRRLQSVCTSQRAKSSSPGRPYGDPQCVSPTSLLYEALGFWTGWKSFTSRYIFNLRRGSTVLVCTGLWKLCRLVLPPLLHAPWGLFPTGWQLAMLRTGFFPARSSKL